MATLLEKALALSPKPREINLTKEQLELIQAWIKDEVTFTQITKVTKQNGTNLYAMLARGAKQMYREGILKLPKS